MGLFPLQLPSLLGDPLTTARKGLASLGDAFQGTPRPISSPSGFVHCRNQGTDAGDFQAETCSTPLASAKCHMGRLSGDRAGPDTAA